MSGGLSYEHLFRVPKCPAPFLPLLQWSLSVTLLQRPLLWPLLRRPLFARATTATLFCPSYKCHLTCPSCEGHRLPIVHWPPFYAPPTAAFLSPPATVTFFWPPYEGLSFFPSYNGGVSSIPRERFDCRVW